MKKNINTRVVIFTIVVWVFRIVPFVIVGICMLIISICEAFQRWAQEFVRLIITPDYVRDAYRLGVRNAKERERKSFISDSRLMKWAYNRGYDRTVKMRDGARAAIKPIIGGRSDDA